MQSHFRVETRTENGAEILSISGELDLAAAASLEEELERALGSGARTIVLDLQSLDFIDSTGLSVLVRAHQRAEDQGLEFGLINPGTQVERLLTLTGLVDRLTLSGNAAGDSPE